MDPQLLPLFDISERLGGCQASSEVGMAFIKWMAEQFAADPFFISEMNSVGILQNSFIYPNVGDSILRESAPAAVELLQTHPFFQRYEDQPPPFDVDSIDSVAPLNAYRNTPLYNELYQKIDIENQTYAFCSVGTDFYAFAVNRSSRKSIGDGLKRRLAQSVKVAISHVIRTRKQEELIRQLLRFDSDEKFIGEIGISRAGVIFHADRPAQDTLSNFLGSTTPVFVLPDSLFMRIMQAMGDEIELGIVPGESDKRLIARVTPEADLVSCRLRLYKLSSSNEPGSNGRNERLRDGLLLLTSRERETLHWMVSGKTNTEIAAIEGVSPHTIAKRAQAIFEKLRVSGRGEIILGSGF